MTTIDIPPPPGNSNYPPELIVRDIAGGAVAGHLRALRRGGISVVDARSHLADRAAGVNRPDLADNPAALTTMADQLDDALTRLLDETIAYAEHGPNPTPDAYAAACRALEKHRARADAAEALLKKVRGYVGEHGDGEIDTWSLREVLAGREVRT